MRHTLPALCLALVACGNAGPDADPQSLDESLAASFGGQTETDEQPAFGDGSAVALTAEDPAVDDSTAAGMRDVRHVRIAIAWGYLRPHPDATEVVDWTGSIQVENAAVRVLRTLRFEDRDMIIRPRTDRTLVEFESHTKPHADGVLLDVIVAPALNPAGEPVTLTFATAPYTHTLTLEPGMRRSAIVKVDDAGHVVAYHIIGVGGNGCHEGFVRGVWKTAASADGRVLGQLEGRITDEDGAPIGALRGLFGERRNGHQVWFAKVVGNEGRFLGVFAGRYADGKFGGLFLGRGRIVGGVVHGEYTEGDGDADGAFMGRWSQRCGEAPDEGDPAAGDEPEVTLADEGSDA